METLRKPAYRVDIYRYNEATCYGVEAAYAYIDEDTGERKPMLMYGRVDGPGEFDIPFASVEEASASLEHDGWTSEDGIVWCKESVAHRGSADIALIGICAMVTTEYVDASEASRMLGISRQRTCELCRDGQLKAERKAGAWIIEKSSVIERIESDPKPGKPVGR